jgi:hypothetical protein
MRGGEEVDGPDDLVDRPLPPVAAPPSEKATTPAPTVSPSDTRHLQPTLLISLLLLAVVLLGQRALHRLEVQHQLDVAAMARVERKVQGLEASVDFASRRRQLLLGMRNRILTANPHVSLDDAYRYAELALAASEKYPTVDPLLMLAMGVVESRYDPQATSPAGARGLYQIWPSTGRVLARALGWNYDDTTLYQPAKNTAAAALYLDTLFSTYDDPRLVLAEYNGGPLNAAYYRASAPALAPETRAYVTRVLELYHRYRDQLEPGTDAGSGVDTGAGPGNGDRPPRGETVDSRPQPAGTRSTRATG